MAEQREAPSVPPQPWFDPKTGNATEGFRRFIIGERGRVRNVNTGVDSLVTAQIQAQANSQTQITAANAAAQAAIAASGSTEIDQDDFSGQGVSSTSFVTIVTNNLNHAGGGDYTISAFAGLDYITSAPKVSGSGSLSGAYQIIENPNDNVLVSGTFAATSTLQSGEFGSPFYGNSIVFTPALPSGDSYGDNESGAVTIELQLRRTSAEANAVSDLLGSLLTEWA